MSIVKGIIGIGVAVFGVVAVKSYADYRYEQGYMNGYGQKAKEEMIKETKNATDDLINQLNDDIMDRIKKMKESQKIEIPIRRNEEIITNKILVDKYGMDEAVKIRWNQMNNRKG